MFTIFILLLNLVLTSLSIYLLDYRIDNTIDNVFMIILSIIIGLLVTAILVWTLIQLFYLSLPKNKIQKSMFTHRILKQIVSVPIHIARMRVKVVGKEHLPKDTGFTIYSNHHSWMDPIIISYGLYDYPVCALGKEGAFNLPVVGKFAPKFGSVMIHRSDPRQSAKAIKSVIENVKNGASMVIFPEGTRSPNPKTLLDFKAGAFKVALRSEKPIVPITLIKKKYRILTRLTIQIHKPLLFEDFKSLKTQELSKQVKSIIESTL